MRCRLLLIGPLPPPEHGTSLPFGYLVDYLGRQQDLEIRVLNSESGDKNSFPLWSPRVAGVFLKLLTGFLLRLGWADSVLVYGSQRFVASAGSLLAPIARLAGKRVVVYVQGGAFDRYWHAQSGIGRLLVRAGLHRSPLLVVQTQQAYQELSGRFRNLAWIPNWIGPGDEPPRRQERQGESGDQPPRRQERQGKFEELTADAGRERCEASSVGHTTATCRLAFVGDVMRLKGIAQLVGAFTRARQCLEQEGIQVQLNLFGPIRDETLTQVLAARPVDQSQIVIHGPTRHDQLLRALSGQDVLVLPTIWPSEGYPGVVLEAMSRGIPVVVTRFRALPEIVVPGVNGLLCEPGDELSLSDCIVRLARDPALRARLGANGRNMARRFSIDFVGPEFRQILAPPGEARGTSFRVSVSSSRPKPVQFWPGSFALAGVGQSIYYSRGYEIWRGCNGQREYLARVPTAPGRVLARLGPGQRLLRAGVRSYLQIDADSFLVFADRSSHYYACSTGRWTTIGPRLRGHGPLVQGCCQGDGGTCYYGDYWPNPRREAVQVYCWRVGWPNWRNYYLFPAGSVRHVHAVQYDPWFKRVWVATGDAEQECLIGYFEPLSAGHEEVQLRVIASGSQLARAVSLVFTPEYVYWGTDAGRDTRVRCNWIVRWSRRDRHLEPVARVGGPVYYSTVDDQQRLYVATAVEGSYSESGRRAQLWMSEDGNHWRQIAAWRKDNCPLIFGYGVLSFPEHLARANKLYVVARNLEPAAGTWVLEV